MYVFPPDTHDDRQVTVFVVARCRASTTLHSGTGGQVCSLQAEHKPRNPCRVFAILCMMNSDSHTAPGQACRKHDACHRYFGVLLPAMMQADRRPFARRAMKRSTLLAPTISGHHVSMRHFLPHPNLLTKLNLSLPSEASARGPPAWTIQFQMQ
jgi:hypothetical protein